MQPIATDGVAWSLCVCLVVTFVIPANTVERIEMLFGGGVGVTYDGQRNHVLNRNRYAPLEWTFFVRLTEKYWDTIRYDTVYLRRALKS